MNAVSMICIIKLIKHNAIIWVCAFCLTNWAGLAAFSIRYFIRHCTFPENKTGDVVSFDLAGADFFVRQKQMTKKLNTENVQCYLGKSLWVGRATILWSLRACSYSSFSEWEWSCDDLPINRIKRSFFHPSKAIGHHIQNVTTFMS